MLVIIVVTYLAGYKKGGGDLLTLNQVSRAKIDMSNIKYCRKNSPAKKCDLSELTMGSIRKAITLKASGEHNFSPAAEIIFSESYSNYHKVIPEIIEFAVSESITYNCDAFPQNYKEQFPDLYQQCKIYSFKATKLIEQHSNKQLNRTR